VVDFGTVMQVRSSDFSLAYPVPDAVNWALFTITLEPFSFGPNFNHVKHSSGYIPKLEDFLPKSIVAARNIINFGCSFIGCYGYHWSFESIRNQEWTP
jgi:hypothetical protein